MVCDFASFQGEARSRDVKRLEDYVAYFETHCQKVAAANGAGLKLSKVGNFRPFLVPLDDPILAIAETACRGLNIKFRAEIGGGGMDANIFSAQGITCVGVATGYTKTTPTASSWFWRTFSSPDAWRPPLIETYAQGCESK